MDATSSLGIDGLVEAEEVGRGGFAVVYRARQPAFGRIVAVKVLNASPDPNSLARFQREIQAMGQLSEHPYIATVLDAGTTATGQLYLLMPFLSGGSLADAVEGGMTFGAREAAEIGVKLAGALQAAHDTEILHRDIKPANVMLGRFGDPLMVDFGIARIAGGHQTTTGVVTATLNHAAPELLDGRPPSVASDIYALGSTLYTLVAGQAPFASTTDQSVVPLISRIAMQPVPRLRGAEEIQVVLDRAMAKDPAQRYVSMDDMAAALADVVAGRPLRAAPNPLADPNSTTRSGVGQGGPPPVPLSSAGTSPEPGTPSRSPSPTVLIGSILGVLVVVALAFALLRSGGGETDPGEIRSAAPDGVTATDGQTSAEDGTDLEGLPVGNVDIAEMAVFADPIESIAVEPNSVTTVVLPQGQAVSLTFSASEGESLRFSAIAVGDEDPFAGLYRDGEILAADDDSGGNGDVLIDYPMLPAGDYEIRLTDRSGDGEVGVSLQLPDTRELGEGQQDSLGDVHEVHAYAVDVSVGAGRGVDVTSDGSQVSLRGLDANGFLVGENSGGEQVPLDLTTSGPGSFVVFVSAPDGSASYDIQPLRLQTADAQPAVQPSLLDRDNLPVPSDARRELEPFETLSVTIGVGEVVSAPFTVDNDMTPVRVLSRSPDGQIDSYALLYRSDGSLIGASDDEGFGVSGTDAIIDQVLPAGDYVALFADLREDTAGPLDLMVARVPATTLEDGVTGNLQARDLPEVYLIAIRPGQPPPAMVAVQADFDARLRLIDSDGSILDSTDGGGNPPVEVGALGIGDYYLFVSAGEAGPYTLITPR